VSDYGLDDRANEVRCPAGARDFFSILCVQAGSGAHPASCPKGTGGPFPGGPFPGGPFPGGPFPGGPFPGGPFPGGKSAAGE
jgi:hypothetical protein